MKSARMTLALLVLLMIVFIALNLASTRWLKGYQVDLTDQQLYTLSSGTKTVLRELESPIELTLYFSDKMSKELPSVRSYARRVTELLQEYQTVADGDIKFNVVDPEPFSEAEDAATLAGLQGIPAGVSGETVYFGLVGRNERGNEEVIPFLQFDQEQFLEYEVTKLIHNLKRPAMPVLGIISSLNMRGHTDMFRGESEPAWVVTQQLEDLFEVRWLEDDLEAIEAEIDVLMVVHPKQLSEQAQLAIDQYVLKGGKAFVFVDPHSEVDIASGPRLNGTRTQSSNLEKLFDAWGVKLREQQVVGDFSQSLVVGVGPGSSPVRHLALLGLKPAAFNTDEVILAGLESINVASIGILEPEEGASTEFVPLLMSSPESAPLDAKRFINLQNPAALFDDFEAQGEVYTLAARISGPAKTAFPDGVEGKQPQKVQAEDIDVIVIADTDILTDRLWVQLEEFFGQRVASPWADNGRFVVNALEFLSGGTALIDIRNRGRFSRPFLVVNELRQQAEEQLRVSEQELRESLQQTEAKLAELEQNQLDGPNSLKPEQLQALQQFQQEKLRIRKELRDVQHELNRDIERLGRNLKMVNILLVPALLILVALIIWLINRNRAVRRRSV